MYVFGPYTLVQAAVTVLTDAGFVVRITNCTNGVDTQNMPVYNIVDIIRMFKGTQPNGKEIKLEVLS